MQTTESSPRADAPPRFCNVVMKGGITSGIVYPRAMADLACSYTFKNIGGTSAGAIAAAATAAAELGRKRGNTNAFTELSELPHLLGARAEGSQSSGLFELFQPQRRTRRTFALITAFMRNPQLAIESTLMIAIASHPIAALAGALPGLICLFGVPGTSGALQGVIFLTGIALAIGGLIAGALIGAAREGIAALNANDFGLCRGFDEKIVSPPLTLWLSRLLNRLAGKEEDGAPLTFGELEDADVHLRVMTTNLTHGKPHTLPFERGGFFFKPAEWKFFFPENVMRQLVGGSEDEFVPLPSARDLPVVVAARMSLSFPLLISAVPLYAIDFGLAAEEREPERCWFSDGGISSNFPIHYFDELLPPHPTFGINLRAFHPRHGGRAVWMPSRNSGGIVPWWNRFDEHEGFARLAGFFTSIANTMQSWRDNEQVRVPGFRDRIAHISLRPDEGGLNLNMDDAKITELAGRGSTAAQMIRERFVDQSDPMSWDNHRWVRFRASMSLLQQTLEEVSDTYESLKSGADDYEKLTLRDASYKVSGAQAANMREAMSDLAALVGKWRAMGKVFVDDDTPKPACVLRVEPPN